ncbi:BnaCnng49690D [Brassica napus]|uniref:(rape) hypothetical protein n=1 Tax=Brassica napus TaxID=3708 RepID=A0A078JI29_BRANA|nr:unnamed protein product [Brassica napus]CDY66160.1 BnaCnng49690D [Brassica napus]
MQPPVENYATPNTCLFHVLPKGAALAFYILYICSLFLTPHFICFRFQQLCHNLCSDCSSCCL